MFKMWQRKSKKGLRMGVYAIRTTPKTYYWRSGSMVNWHSGTPTLYTKITDAKIALKDVHDYFGTDPANVNNYPKIVNYVEEKR